MGSEWARLELKCLKQAYEEMDLDTNTVEFKKKVALIMKLDLKKLAEAAGKGRKRSAASEKVQLDWGDILQDKWSKKLSWEDVKKKLSEVADGDWKVDPACPQTWASGKRVCRRYVNRDLEQHMYVRVIQETDLTYTVQEGNVKLLEDDEDDEGGEEAVEESAPAPAAELGAGKDKRTVRGCKDKAGGGAGTSKPAQPEPLPPSGRGARKKTKK